MMVKDLLNNMYSLGIGAASYSKEQIEKTVHELVKRGDVARAESGALIDELVDRGKKAQQEVEDMIQGRVRQLLSSMDVPTKEEVQALQQRVDLLEQKLVQTEKETDA